MQNRIQAYYRGERVSSVLFISYGLACLIGSYAYYSLVGSSLSFGLFTSAGLIGLGILIIGLARFWKTIQFYNHAMASDGSQYLIQTEYPRLETKEIKYSRMRMIMTACIIISFLIMIIFSFVHSAKVLIGTAIGIALHAGFILSFDLFAQYRMKEYMHHISKLNN